MPGRSQPPADQQQQSSGSSPFAGCFGCSRRHRQPSSSSATAPSGGRRRSRAESKREIRRLRSRLFEFINSKQQPRNYSLMIRYLLHWQVSVYSLVWTDVLLWIGLYTAVNAIYRHLLSPPQQMTFVRLVHSVGVWQTNVPVTFLLGFYVSTVVERWWKAYLDIPTMSTAALRIETAVFNTRDPGKAERIRLTLSRYMNLAWLLYMWKISEKIKQRFRLLRSLIGETNRNAAEQRMDWGSISSRQTATTAATTATASTVAGGGHHLETSGHLDAFHSRVGANGRAYPVLRRIQSVRDADAKQRQVELLVQDLALLNQDPVVQENYGELITPSEIAVYEERARQAAGAYSIEYELPLHWAAAVAWQAAREGFLHGYEGYEAVVRLLCDWSGLLGAISKYANKNLPLVYTQVVIIAVYTWFFIEVVASQNLMQAHVANMTAIVDGHVRSAGGDSLSQAAAPSHWYITQYWTDFYVPVFALVKLLFVLGWFKVAFLLMDPYGDEVDGLPFSDVLNSNLRRGRVMAGFPMRLYPRKLAAAAAAAAPPPTSSSSSKYFAADAAATSSATSPTTGFGYDGDNGDYLHSDDELTQELRDRQAGPWCGGCHGHGGGERLQASPSPLQPVEGDGDGDDDDIVDEQLP